MLKTSGLMLDVHDDISGDTLRGFFPTPEAIPEVIKQAHALSPSDRDRLPDDDFALVLVDQDQKLRKYACIDEGNTRLSVLYFAANAHKLPEEAQKVAAANLATACNWYGIEVPEEIEKIAIGLATGLTLLSAPATIKGTHTQMKQNMANIKAHEAAGQTVVAKHAEVANTSLMPGQPPSDRSVKPSKTVVQKTAMSPYVDVSSSEAAKLPVEKKASRTVLNGRYPLDSYEQVKAASAYFDEFGKRMQPEERREYCLGLVKRADELGIKISSDARKYGSEGYAPEDEIKVALDARRSILMDPVERLILDELAEKKAMMSPEDFCATLEEFDKVAELAHHYDSYIPDPFYSTYGTKEAEEYSFLNGNDIVTEKDLQCFGSTKFRSLQATFGEDFAKEFQKDPVGIFKSMPLVQKRMIMRMATDNSPGSELKV